MGSKRIAIVGAGLAGLTAALAARKFGLEVRLFEQAPDFKQIGGGIMIHSNGMRVLEALDQLDGFLPHMRLTPLIHLEAPRGKRLSTTDFREVAIPHNRAAVVMRYRLQEYLLGAAERAGVRTHFGHRLTDLSCASGQAILRFAGGAEEEFDVVIAGDGLRSQARRSCGLAASEQELGKAYIRGISDYPSKVSDVREVWGPDGRLFGICPLP
jgi:2-polyprenyl-6-methoxyphenol hydroxylase-like FAD-dependent oxidoreductase